MMCLKQYALAFRSCNQVLRGMHLSQLTHRGHKSQDRFLCRQSRMLSPRTHVKYIRLTISAIRIAPSNAQHFMIPGSGKFHVAPSHVFLCNQHIIEKPFLEGAQIDSRLDRSLGRPVQTTDLHNTDLWGGAGVRGIADF